MHTEHHFLAFDAAPIFYRKFLPSGEAKAALILNHGAGEHGGRYVLFAEYLTQRGIAVYLPDLRGYGKSGGARAYAQKPDDFYRDLSALQGVVSQNHPGKPLFLMGHSMGGLISTSYLEAHAGFHGLVLSSPLFGMQMNVPAWKKCAGEMLARIWPKLRLATGIHPLMLTKDREVLKAYTQDRLISQQMSAGLYSVINQLMASVGTLAPKITLPVLIVQAGEDRVVKRKSVEVFFARLGSHDKKLQIAEDSYHEVLNDSRRDEVVELISSWLLSKF